MFRPLVLLACLLPAVVGCKATLTKMAADLTGEMVHTAVPKIQSHFDTVLFGDGLPGLILLVEGVVATSPNNDQARLDLAQAYCSYTYGWIENEYEMAETEGDFDKADAIRHRGVKLYKRARNMGLHVMRERDAGIDEALKDQDDLRAYLKSEYHRASDAPTLFWTAMGWGSAINIGRDDPMLVADLATVKVIAERAAELDPEYYFGAPLALLGAMEAALPEAMGGQPALGKELYERALAVTDRRNTLLLVLYARTYAMVVGDRDMYQSLLQEVINAEDPGDELRLLHEIAKKRADRYMANIDADL